MNTDIRHNVVFQPGVAYKHFAYKKACTWINCLQKRFHKWFGKLFCYRKTFMYKNLMDGQTCWIVMTKSNII